MNLLRIFFVIILFSSCKIFNINRNNIDLNKVSKVTFIDTIEIPYNYIYDSTVVGGLSGITYDAKKQLFYAISDDRSQYSPARMYGMNIVEKNNNFSLQFKEIIFLLTNTNKRYNNRKYYEEQFNKSKQPKYYVPDAEDVAFDSKNDKFIWVSEGENTIINDVKIVQHPAIHVMNRSGRNLYNFSITKDMRFSDSTGPITNKSLEAVCITPSNNYVYVGMEAPYKEDLFNNVSNQYFTRIYQYSNATRSHLNTYLYPLFNPTQSDTFLLTGMTALNDSTILTLERHFNKVTKENKAQLFITSIKKENALNKKFNINNTATFNPLDKTLLFSTNQLSNIPIDNIEGISLGPIIKGKQSIFLISDNNFSPLQKTIIYILILE